MEATTCVLKLFLSIIFGMAIATAQLPPDQPELLFSVHPIYPDTLSLIYRDSFLDNFEPTEQLAYSFKPEGSSVETGALSRLEFLMLKLTQSPGTAESFRKRLIALIDPQNPESFDLAKLISSKGIAYKFGGNKPILEVLNSTYPGLINPDGRSINVQAIEEAKKPKPQVPCKIIAPTRKEVPGECSFAKIWDNQTTKDLMAELREKIRESQKSANATFSFIKTTPPTTLSLTWMYNGSAYQILRGMVQRSDCLNIGKYEITAYPDALASLFEKDEQKSKMTGPTSVSPLSRTKSTRTEKVE